MSKISRYKKCICGFEFIEYHFHHCPACMESIEWVKNPPDVIDNIEPVKLETLQPFDVFLFEGNYYIYKNTGFIATAPNYMDICIKLPSYNTYYLYKSLYVYPVKDIELNVKLK